MFGRLLQQSLTAGGRVATAIQQYGSCHTTTCQRARKRLKQRIGKSSFTIQQLAELALFYWSLSFSNPRKMRKFAV
jgi:hypothetical protein